MSQADSNAKIFIQDVAKQFSGENMQQGLALTDLTLGPHCC
jgi:hypothetical protein